MFWLIAAEFAIYGLSHTDTAFVLSELRAVDWNRPDAPEKAQRALLSTGLFWSARVGKIGDTVVAVLEEVYPWVLYPGWGYTEKHGQVYSLTLHHLNLLGRGWSLGATGSLGGVRGLALNLGRRGTPGHPTELRARAFVGVRSWRDGFTEEATELGLDLGWAGLGWALGLAGELYQGSFDSSQVAQNQDGFDQTWAIGPWFRLDTRWPPQRPLKGILASGRFMPGWGEAPHQRAEGELAGFRTLGPLTFALDLRARWTKNAPPYRQPTLGGSEGLRGYSYPTLRAPLVWVFTAEIRTRVLNRALFGIPTEGYLVPLIQTGGDGESRLISAGLAAVLGTPFTGYIRGELDYGEALKLWLMVGWGF